MAAAKASGGRKISRRWRTFLWVLGVSLVTIILLVKERADVLYILSTLGVTVLLVMVAQADLSGSKKEPAAGPDDLNPAN